MATTYPLRALADLAPVLEAPDADFGHWFTPLTAIVRSDRFVEGSRRAAILLDTGG